MKILLLDTENAPNYAATWGIHDQRVRYSDVIQEWFFLSAQWKWLGDKGVSSVSLLDNPKQFIKDHTNDTIVVKTVHSLMEEADVIVGHNIKGHDLKKLYAKFIEHRIEPPKDLFIVDTLQWAKKFGFTSRKLGDLCTKLGLEHKLEHEPGIFTLAGRGDVKALRKVVRYGIGDIPTLEALYLTLRPYITNHPNQNQFSETSCCPDCGGTHFHKRGMNRNRTQHTYACYDCRARFPESKLKRKKHVS